MTDNNLRGGYVKSYRSTLHNPAFRRNKNLYILWQHILHEADRNDATIKVSRLATSEYLYMSPSTFRDALARLEKLGMVQLTPMSDHTIVFIVNYAKYQTWDGVKKVVQNPTASTTASTTADNRGKTQKYDSYPDTYPDSYPDTITRRTRRTRNNTNNEEVFSSLAAILTNKSTYVPDVHGKLIAKALASATIEDLTLAAHRYARLFVSEDWWKERKHLKTVAKFLSGSPRHQPVWFEQLESAREEEFKLPADRAVVAAEQASRSALSDAELGADMAAKIAKLREQNNKPEEN